MADLEMLKRVDRAGVAATERDREVQTFGPFRALLDPTTDLVYLNYAVPTGPFDDAALRRLIEHFEARRRRPRFEFNEDLWPELGASLAERGFRLESRQPLMLCSPETFRARSVAGVDIEILGPQDDVAAFLQVAHQSFGFSDAPADEQIAHTREGIARRSLRCALARIGSEPAGVGTTTPLLGVAELAGVGTAERFRRRGVASAVSTVLLQDHFRDGDIAWLSAGDDAAEAVYRRLGFERAGWRLSYIL